jgi:hypothetical protein
MHTYINTINTTMQAIRALRLKKQSYIASDNEMHRRGNKELLNQNRETCIKLTYTS